MEKGRPKQAKSNILWLLALLLATALIARLWAFQAWRDSQGWVNIISLWQPWEGQTACRFWLPGRYPLAVTCVKSPGGSHNRTWSLTIEECSSAAPDHPWRTSQVSLLGNVGGWPSCGRRLSQREFVGSNDGVLEDPHPELYYRRWGDGWQFLTYQGNDNSPGPIEVREQPVMAGQECPFGEGYFIFQVDDQGGTVNWRPCNRWGQPW